MWWSREWASGIPRSSRNDLVDVKVIRIVAVPVYHDKELISHVLVGEVVQDWVDSCGEGHCNDGYYIYHGCSVFVTVVDVCKDVINEAW